METWVSLWAPSAQILSFYKYVAETKEVSVFWVDAGVYMVRGPGQS